MVDKMEEYHAKLFAMLENDNMWEDGFASFLLVSGYHPTDDQTTHATFMTFLAGATMFHDLVIAVKGNPEKAVLLHERTREASRLLNASMEPVRGNA